jgi:hypothetical protein
LFLEGQSGPFGRYWRVQNEADGEVLDDTPGVPSESPRGNTSGRSELLKAADQPDHVFKIRSWPLSHVFSSHPIKVRHVVVASHRIAIGSGVTGLASACDPRRIMICFPVKDATEVHPNGRCRRPGCEQLFARAEATEKAS